jgi:hypothetical protein
MRRLGLMLVFALPSLTGATDYTITRRTTIDNGTPQEQTEYWGRKRLVVDDTQQRYTVDFGKQQVTAIDKDERTYWTLPLDRVVRQLLAIGAAGDALPEPAREMLGLTRRVSVSPTGDTSTIATRQAKEYALGGDGVRGFVWLAEDIDPGTLLGDEAAAWWRGGGPLRAVGPLEDVAQAIGQQKIRGMPVWVSLTATSESRSTTVDSQVSAIREEPPPPDIERLPDGLRRVQPPLPAE